MKYANVSKSALERQKVLTPERTNIRKKSILSNLKNQLSGLKHVQNEVLLRFGIIISNCFVKKAAITWSEVSFWRFRYHVVWQPG